jgi:hypothetical protein
LNTKCKIISHSEVNKFNNNSSRAGSFGEILTQKEEVTGNDKVVPEFN